MSHRVLVIFILYEKPMIPESRSQSYKGMKQKWQNKYILKISARINLVKTCNEKLYSRVRWFRWGFEKTHSTKRIKQIKKREKKKIMREPPDRFLCLLQLVSHSRNYKAFNILNIFFNQCAEGIALYYSQLFFHLILRGTRAWTIRGISSSEIV